jgi:thioesterase domain-containing protein/acyl carrier protein
MGAAFDLFLAQQREPPFDEVEPGRAGRGEVQVEPRVPHEPAADPRRLVRAIVIEDQMDVKIPGHGRVDRVEKLEKLLTPMTSMAFTKDFARRDVERGEERRGAMPAIVMGAALGRAERHRQHRRRAIQRLNLALLVDTQDQGSIRGRQIQPHNVTDLLDKERIPRQLIAFVESLPRLTNGKVDRSALCDAGEAPGTEPQASAAPRTAIERELAEIWAQVLGVAHVGIHDSFFDLGGHSLLSVQLIARIEKTFGRTLPVALLFQSPTIGQLAAILGNDARSQTWSSLMPLQTAGSRVPFVWIHGDSSNASLPGYLGPDRPLYALEHQAHDGRPAQYTQVETIAQHYLEELRTIRPHGPYLLGGYSFGAAVAFEAARQLTADGERVGMLFLLDPPGQADRGVVSAPRRWIARARTLTLREKIDALPRRLATAARDRLASRGARLAKHLKNAHARFCVMRGRLLPPALRSAYILRVYKRAIRTYTPQVYSGPVTIFKGDKVSYRTPLDWPHLISGPVDIHTTPGGHMDLTREPHVAVWAARLRESLDRFDDKFPSWTPLTEIGKAPPQPCETDRCTTQVVVGCPVRTVA